MSPRAGARYKRGMAASRELDVSCTWQHALNVAPNRKGPFGYLLDWSGLGGVVLAKDILAWNPLSGTSQAHLGGPTVSCVGVIERFRFGGIETDPIRISCFLSQENQTNLRAKLARDLVNTRVKLRWSVVAYDEAAKAWYRAIELVEPRELHGVVNTVDGELQIAVEVAPTALGEQALVNVYRFELEVVPPPRKRATLHFALGQNQRIVTAWGEE